MAFGIAVVGLDHWYTAFGLLDAAAGSSVAPLVAICETDPARQDEVRGKYPHAFVTGDLDAVLSRPDVELVAICTATDQAPAIAIRALQAGKHVVSVKPPARTLAELDTVLAAAQTSGKFYGSFEGMQRLTPRVTLLRDLVQGGAIGTPMSYFQRGHGGLPAPWPGQTGPSWWTDAARVPGGAWIDHAIYAVDLSRFVFGGEVDWATGLIETRVHHNLQMEDYGMSLMRLRPASGASPVSLVFEDTWTASAGGGAHRQELIGTDGTLRPDNNEWVVSVGGTETRHAIPAAPFFRLDALADMLLQGETPPFGPADARANLAACLAVYAGAAEATAR